MEKITYRIHEIGEVVGGGTPSTSNDSFWGGDVPWISPDDLTDYNHVHISHGKNFITELGFKKSSTKMLPEGSLLISSRAPIGYVAIAANPVCTNQGFKSIVFNNKVNNLYFYYWMKCNIEYVRLFGSGATFPEISGSRMKKIKVEVFKDLNIQQGIAKTLNAYDKLIENNNNRIEALENLADSLFNEWFIRFRFPGHEKYDKKESELGLIPSCFNILKAKEVFEYYIGGGWGSDVSSADFPVDAYVIRGTDFPFVSKSDISTCPHRYHKVSNYRPRQLQENDIVFEISGGTADQPVGRAILVTKGVLEQLDNKVICASFCKLIRPNYSIVTPNYLNYWLKFLYDSRMIERFQLQSTGIINFKYEYFLKKGPILVAPIELIKRFESIVKPMRDEIDILALENVTLLKQRDALLPRLMSGKLSVEGKEIV